MAVIVKLDDYRTIPAQVALAYIRKSPWLSEEDRQIIWQVFVKPKGPWWPAVADINNSAQTEGEPKSIASAVQMLGAEWRAD